MAMNERSVKISLEQLHFVRSATQSEPSSPEKMPAFALHESGIFIDWVSLVQTHNDFQGRIESGDFDLQNPEEAKPIHPVVCSARKMIYRQAGDTGINGEIVEQDEIDADCLAPLSYRGSHETNLQIKSDGKRISLSGNVGRFHRPENVFNLGWADTLAKANDVMQSLNLPPFFAGVCAPTTSNTHSRIKRGRSLHWTGATVQCLHLTKNYLCGSHDDALAVINWLDSQSVKRMKRGRLGLTTVVFGDPKYIQVEFYLKGAELLAHKKTGNLPIAQWCKDAGMLRAEVKISADALRDFNLRYVGEVTMTKIVQLFVQRTEILYRVRPQIEEFDSSLLPKHVRLTAEAWLKGIDVKTTLSNGAFYRQAGILRDYGIDIATPRNIETFPVRVRTINIQAAQLPDWYDLRAAA